MRTRWLLIAFMAFSSPSFAHTQGAPDLLRPRPSHLLWRRSESFRTAEPTQEPLGGILGRGDLDHRYTGFFVGSGVGVGLTIFGLAYCSAENTCTSKGMAQAVLATGILGISGALIGGLFPKPPPP
jgi:hypothetical protein